MLEQNQDMLQKIWTIFVTLKNWFKTKTVFFQIDFSKNLFFQNFTKYKNKIFKLF